MKRFIFCLLLLFFVLPIFSCQATNDHLLIVEIQIAGEKASNDFIKIYNPSDKTLDISGYKLRKRVSTGSESSVCVFPKNSQIGSKNYFLWANSKDGYAKSIGADVERTATLAKDNSIAILNPDNEIIDALAWGESQNPFVEGLPFPTNPKANQQLKRKQSEGAYQDTDNNNQDFELWPASTEAQELKLPEQEQQGGKEEEEKQEGQGDDELAEKPEISFQTGSGSQISVSSDSGSPSQSNLPPIAEAGNDIIAQIGAEINFDGSKSFDPDNDELTYFWNFGDGETSKQATSTHLYKYPGEYLVCLTVSDGKSENSDTLKVTILARGVIINEFLPNPESEDEENEWIEILNTNDFIVDISNWKLSDESGKTFVFPKKSFILPFQFLTISRPTTKIALNNDKDSLSFLYPNDVLIEKISYENGKKKKGWSIARTSEGEFVWTKIPTPGMANIVLSSTLWEEKIGNLPEKKFSKEVKDNSSTSSKDILLKPSAGSDLSQINPKIIQKLVFNKEPSKTSQTKNNKEQSSTPNNDPSQFFADSTSSKSFSVAGLGLGIPSLAKIILPALGIAILAGAIVLLLKKKIEALKF